MRLARPRERATSEMEKSSSLISTARRAFAPAKWTRRRCELDFVPWTRRVGKGAHRRQVYAVCASLTALRAVELLSTMQIILRARLCPPLFYSSGTSFALEFAVQPAGKE